MGDVTDFQQVFSPTQQFLLLQAYVDRVLSEAELLNFSLLETTDQVPVVFYTKGMLVITPAVDFDQFSHAFYPAKDLGLRQVQEKLAITAPTEHWELTFQDEAEARQMKADLTYLFQQTAEE